jgi:transcription elongation factor S-II
MAMDVKEIDATGKALLKAAARDAPRIAARDAAREAAREAAKTAGLDAAGIAAAVSDSDRSSQRMPEDEEKVVKGLLADIQQGVRATEDLLRQTRIGIIVNKLKPSTSAEVAVLASRIVGKWRDDVKKQKHGGSTAASRAPSGSPMPAKKGTGPPTPVTPSDKASKPSVPLDKRTWKTDGAEINHTGNKIRDSFTGLIYDGLCFGSSEAPKTILSRAIAVEAAAYSHLGPETKEDYRGKIRSLFQNLKTKSNPKLRVRVLDGEITAEKFVRMTHDELRSVEQREADAKIQKENMDKAMVAQQERSISKSLQCGKCGQRKVTYTEAQTRAADEPMTLFCTCLNCGKSWRQ